MAAETGVRELANLYLAQGRYGEAEPVYKRALAIFETALGPDHPHVGASLNKLANLYRAQGGRHYEAAPFFKRALAIMEKALGPNHPNVAKSLENYAALLRETGRGAETHKMDARAKAIRDKWAKENK